jgi:hypothetical protein
MADTLQGWTQRAVTLPAAIVRATPGAVVAGADVLEAEARANLLRASGGDMRLSRVRSGKGGTMSLRVRTVGSGSNARAEVVPTGPVMLLEADTPRHVEPFRYLAERSGGTRAYSMARRRKAQRKPSMYLPGLGNFQRVNHPGTRGQQPVGRAFEQAHDRAGQAGVQVFMDAVARHMSD